MSSNNKNIEAFAEIVDDNPEVCVSLDNRGFCYVSWVAGLTEVIEEDIRSLRIGPFTETGNQPWSPFIWYRSPQSKRKVVVRLSQEASPEYVSYYPIDGLDLPSLLYKAKSGLLILNAYLRLGYDDLFLLGDDTVYIHCKQPERHLVFIERTLGMLDTALN